MASPKPPAAYLAVAQPLAEAVLTEARAHPESELERIEATLRPLLAWRIPAVAEHASALLALMADLRALRERQP